MGLLAKTIQQNKKNFIKLSEAITIVANITNDSEEDVVRFFHCTSTPIYAEWLEGIELFRDNGYGGYYPGGEFLVAIDYYCGDIKNYHNLREDEFFRSAYLEKDKFFSKDLIDILGVSFEIENFDLSEAMPSFENKEIEDITNRKMEDRRRKYIAVNDFVNSLSKGSDFKQGGSFGAGNPLRVAIEGILESIPLNDIGLYKLEGTVYSLVSQADKYKNSTEVLRTFYGVLDDDQTGTVTSDREPFKGFYFKYSDVGYLIGSDSKAIEIEDTETRTNEEVGTNQLKYDDEVSDQTVEKLKKMTADYEDLKLKYEELERQNKGPFDKIEQHKQDNSEELRQHWESESIKHKSKIEELETVIKGFSDIETLSQDGDWQLYNWKSMDENQYPPELHLVIEIWKRYYKASDTEDITRFNTHKFNRITKELNLKDGKLKSRIRSVLTPLKSKKTSTPLLVTLRDVDILYNDKMID
ncbi:hypothetical protein QL919_02885 [Psychrobacter sp. APC 3426]|uniref:hypothetical protein n=1 Tax=Psychrobacter sp. APC 3426 TaxID=3035177 RepID=UPI0025B4C1D7|nr:hypothetical protein [Psychrobacter sp. APC 3426]MDN3397671.1 hypothetical protein [Psychrobacter sp. APC 3426]